ncbi:hypothetical protein CLOM_g3443 [Closterium sp. NIES-68]|nr:hypothetical protein CLOM_g3443 [Closterium sp. NIES-68]
MRRSGEEALKRVFEERRKGRWGEWKLRGAFRKARTALLHLEWGDEWLRSKAEEIGLLPPLLVLLVVLVVVLLVLLLVLLVVLVLLLVVLVVEVLSLVLVLWRGGLELGGEGEDEESEEEEGSGGV